MRFLGIILFTICFSVAVYSQPKNDSCSKSQLIPISSSGYATGVFTTDTFNISGAKVESSEFFHSDLVSVGNNKKSIWFKFYLPVKRAVKIELKQPNTKISTKDAGFVTYKANSCFPGLTEATSAYITPLNQFGSSFHPCMEAGWYMIQVGSKTAANGPVFIELTISYPVQYSINSSFFDLTDSAYNFGTLAIGRNEKKIEYETGCQTLQDSSEYYPKIGKDYKDFSQTAWHIFKTATRIDYLELLMAEAFASPMIYFPTGTKIYANLYEGNVKTNNYKTLKIVDSCILFDFDNRISPKGFAGKSYSCLLKPNTFYSIQLIFKSDFYKNIQLTIRQRTADSATLSPTPLKGVFKSNSNLGVLPSSFSGIVTTINDYMSCESRMINSTCGTANPADGVIIGGTKYKLASWSVFKLNTPANLKFEFFNTSNNQCSGNLAFRLFKDTLKSNCTSFDTSKIYSKGKFDGKFLYCVPQGDYILQLLGIDTASFTCGTGEHLGYNLGVNIRVFSAVDYSKFGLSDSSRIDTLNAFKPLKTGVSYDSKLDEFGCGHNVLPGANRCDTSHKKAIYRLFKIGDTDGDNKADSGLLSIFNLKTNQGPEKIQYVLYNKNLRSLSISQSKYFYPDTLSNPGQISACTNYNVGYNGASSRYYCVTPGDYTLGSFGGVNHLGVRDQPVFIFTKTVSKYNKPTTPENMDTIRAEKKSKIDFFNCLNNAEVIDGALPCGNKKVIYREFYLENAQLIEISNTDPSSFDNITLYKGRISQGKAGLKIMKDPDGRKWECFTKQQTNDCYPIPKGWYTIVSSVSGPGYDDKIPFDDVAHQGSGSVNGRSQITIKILQQITSRFNRPYKAWPIDDSLNKGKPLSWKPNYGTSAYPKNGYIFNLRQENFTCIPDTPFSSHPISPCNNDYNHIAYYVFSLQYESYLRISGLNTDIKALIFDFDVRKDSTKMASVSPIQNCNTYSRVEICRIKPGTYTLVLLGSKGLTFPFKVSPTLYIDSVGTSRFDFASKAYDFGRVTGDSVWYSGKKGTTHPNVSGRAASSDFIFCTTGASTTDPMFACGGYYNPNIYPDKQNNALYNIDSIGSKYTYLGYHAVRNLWYSFTLKGAGKAKIKIENKTSGTQWGNNLSYGLYVSDENGNLNFDTLRKYGKIDSTAAMGLSQIEYKPNSGQCNGVDWLNLTKDICDSVNERRYYIVVSLNEVTLPNLNTQVDVSIIFDSVPIPPKRYDYYSQANVINGLNQVSPPYSNVILNSNKLYTGNNGFFVSTTTDSADRTVKCSTYGKKNGTIWYKFRADSTGTLFVNLRRYTFSSSYNNYIDYTPANNKYDENIILLKEIISGDSSKKGLAQVKFDYNPVTISKFNRDFASTCINKGWYYIQLSSCGLECSDMLVPEFVIQYQRGDFCNTPINLKLDSIGVTAGTAIVNCHSIGEGYGENGSNMGCLYGPNGYKSTWFKLDYTDSAKADIEFKLTENTNVLPKDIRFRTFYGGCNALTPGPCNTNSQTVFSLTCMKKGSYFIQVVSPSSAIGSIDLNVKATKNLDTSCKPYETWTPNANFTTKRTCPLNIISFINYSTKGDSIRYKWDFGFSKTDTVFEPTVTFPVSTSDVTYKIKLLVYNVTRSGKDSITQNITIPATPVVKLPNDTAVCMGDTVYFKYKHPQYRHYWQDKSTIQIFKAFKTSSVILSVVQKSGNDSCIITDTAFVKINNNPKVNLGNDTFTCISDSITVSGPTGMKNYIWSNGKTSQSQKINNQTVSLLVIDNNNCRDIDTISATLKTYTDTIIKPVKQVCVNVNSIKINVKPTYSGFFYGNSNIDSKGNFKPYSAGSGNHKIYYQFSDNYGCKFKDSTIVKVNPLPDASITAAGPFCVDAGIMQIKPKTNPGGFFKGGIFIDSSGKFNTSNAKYGANKIYYFVTDVNNCSNSDSSIIIVNRLPDSKINSDGPFCIDAGIQRFVPKLNSGGTFYGGSFIDSAGYFDPAKAGSGSHKIYYRFTDKNKCSSFDSTIVKVNSLPDATIAASGPYCIDVGIKQLKPKTNFGGIFYGGNYIDSSGKFNPLTAGAGTKRVFYNFRDANNCVNTDSIDIVVNPLPDAAIVPSGPHCIDAGLQSVTAKINYGGKFFGGNYIDSSGIFNPLLAGLGTHKVKYIFTDKNNCTNSDSTFITVNSLPDASITPDGPFCIDAGIQIIIPKLNTGGKFYGGKYIDSSGYFNPATAGAGLHKIIYFYSDGNKCSNTDSIYIKVNPLPDASIAASGPYCIDAGIKIIYPKLNFGGKFYGGIYIDTIGNFLPANANTGLNKIFYKYTDANNCTNTDSINITVNPLPDAAILPSGPYCIDNGISIILPKTNNGGIFYGGKYIDSLGNFNSITAKSGFHKIIYKITDMNNCFNKDSIYVKVNPLPDASLVSAGPFCVDEGLKTIIPKINKGGKFYGGNYIDTLGNFNTKKSTIGLNKIYYKYTDANTCSSKDSILIKINPLPDASLLPANQLCIDSKPIKLIPKTNLGGKFFGGIYIDSIGTFSPNQAGIGIFKSYYKFTDNNKCTAIDSLNVTVNALPDASIVPAGPFCVNYVSALIKPRVNTGGKFYGGIYIDSTGNFNNLIAGVGKHKVLYKISDGNKCSNKDSIFIIVNGLPDASIVPAGPFCDNDGIKVISPAVTPNGVFYGVPFIDAVGNFNTGLAGPGTHQIFYKVTNSNNCTNKDSSLIKVNGKPIFDFTANPTSGCEPLDVSFNATSGYKKYEWNFGDSKTSTGDSTINTYKKYGNYNVTLKVTDNNNCTVTINKPDYIQVFQRPQADFNYSPFEINMSITPVQFTNFSSGNNITKFQWSIDDKFETDQEHFSKIFHDSGNIKISLLTVNSWGCRDSISQYIFVIDTFIIFIPNAFSPNFDGINDEFKVGGIGIRYLEMTIYNRWGEKLFSQSDNSNSFGWNGIYLGEQVPQGIYFYTIMARDNKRHKYLFEGTISVLR
ncbi:MAG: gliding motility-associated C-terminal domain-containing protein [Bacteroidetes bacterium]|nr:gliding motility-associated C-terminal domain-containing protein [Bacteroidota bacterium]